MPGRECYHCKQWIEPGEAHDCWTTTEAALTEDLSEDLREAWERLRETAAARASRTTVVNVVHIRHRDEVEPPITDWLKEAYDVSEALSATGAVKRARKMKKHTA
ncbi:MAG: hypothetical protein HYY76_05155 [Acidobacteria bacterium]|nr:hypothetical protein [Acidobacteriota bacterium]